MYRNNIQSLSFHLYLTCRSQRPIRCNPPRFALVEGRIGRLIGCQQWHLIWFYQQEVPKLYGCSCVWAPVSLIPDEAMDAYNLHDKVLNGKVLVKIIRGMHGLPQAGRLAHEQLTEHLQPYGYAPCTRTPGLWKHESKPTTFCLTVDDFGVKHVGRENAEHLIQSLRAKCDVTTDWEGKLCCGIQLDWNYKERWVDISMPTYVREMLHRFNHPMPSRPEHAPHRFTRIQHGAGPQLAEADDDSPPLDDKGINLVQQKVGSAHYSNCCASRSIFCPSFCIVAWHRQVVEYSSEPMESIRGDRVNPVIRR